ncbi:MAG: hypothetical protein ABFD07_01510 [Methanobacterium sp.]
MTRLKERRSGPPRIYDREQIIKGIRAGKTNSQVAVDVGCTAGHVYEIRGKLERARKRRLR